VNYFLKPLSKTLLGLLLLNGSYLQADTFYAELNSAYSFTELNEEEFNPITLEARLGMYLEQQVGVEAYYASGVNDDTQLAIDLAIKSVAGINFRFESPEADGMKIFILLGYGMTEWDLDRSDTGEPGKVDFDDFSYGAGFEWRLGQSNNWFVNLRGQRFLNKDDLKLDTGSLGVRYVF
jgi:hypothetical protein